VNRPRGYAERKFLLPPGMTGPFLALFQGWTEPDRSGPDGCYTIATTYFDTPRLDFFFDKVEGEFRKVKVRLRAYAAADGLGPGLTERAGEPFDREDRASGPTWSGWHLELKSRQGAMVFKRRIPVEPAVAVRLLAEGPRLPDLEPLFGPGLPPAAARAALGGVLKPVVRTIYRRRALVVPSLPGMRLTFDHDVIACLPGGDLESPRTVEGGRSPGPLRLPVEVIFEIKSDGQIPGALLYQLKSRGIGAVSVSKYSLSLEHLLQHQGDPRLSVPMGREG